MSNDSATSTPAERAARRVVGQPAPGETERTVGQLVADASHDLSSLIQNEIQLAKTEVSRGISFGGKGAAFLGIGSQAASIREVQTLSMPVTVAQILIFLLASFAVGPFNSLVAILAAVFPFSSPLAMIARAAYFHHRRGETSGLDLNAHAALPFPGLRDPA